MALQDALPKPVKAKPIGWYEQLTAQLDKDDQEYLDSCLADTTNYSGAYIARKLTQAGYPVSTTTINEYRKKHING